MDNGACDLFKNILPKKNIPLPDPPPPHIHLQNAAERAIKTFKSHFISGIWLTDPKYPAQELDRLLPQETMTLNMLPISYNNPKLSVYAAFFGIHDFNHFPLAPPGKN